MPLAVKNSTQSLRTASAISFFFSRNASSLYFADSVAATIWMRPRTSVSMTCARDADGYQYRRLSQQMHAPPSDTP